jgi:hypothetical protein
MVIGSGERASGAYRVIGQRITDNGNVLDIRPYGVSVWEMRRLRRSGNGVIIFVLVFEKGLSYGIILPSAPRCMLGVEIPCENYLVPDANEEV